MFRNLLLTVSLSALVALSTATILSARAYSSQTGLLNPQIAHTAVEPESADQYHITFKGGEKGVVEITGEETTVLELSVYDENGNLVWHQTGRNPWIEFTPFWTQTFTVRVYNRGLLPNEYVLRTN